MQDTIPRSVHAPTGRVAPLHPRAAAIRVAVAHGEALVRAGVRALLERESDVCVVGEASAGDQAVALADELRPDVLIIDLRLPGLGALDATRRIAGASDAPDTQVLVVGGGSSDEELFSALHAGAGGFLLHDTDPVELLRAVRHLAQGDALLSPAVTRRLIDEFASQPDPGRPVPERLAELTAREREVMSLVALGLTNDQIAARLVVSRATAKTHVSRAMLKLHAHDRAQLVTLAYQSRLVEPRRSPGRPAPLALLAA